MSRHRVVPSDDYREFVFRATGRTTDLGNLSPVDLHDNLIVELDRLKALGDLMAGCAGPLEAEVSKGLAEVLRDIQDRMREILRAARRKGRT